MISYSAADRERVRPFRDALAGHFDVTWDQDLPPGQEWDKNLKQIIASVRCVLLFLSNEAADSKYVKHEVWLAQELKRKLIPVFLDPLRIDQMPFGLPSTNAARLFNARSVDKEQELEKLQKELSEACLPRFAKARIAAEQAVTKNMRERFEAATAKENALNHELHTLSKALQEERVRAERAERSATAQIEENQSLTDRNAQLHADASTHAQKLQNLAQQVVDCQAELAKIRADHEGASKQLQSRKDEVADLERRYQALQNEHHRVRQQKADAEAATGYAREELDQLRVKLPTLERTAMDARATAAVQQAETERLRAASQEQEERIKRLKSAIVQLKADRRNGSLSRVPLWQLAGAGAFVIASWFAVGFGAVTVNDRQRQASVTAAASDLGASTALWQGKVTQMQKRAEAEQDKVRMLERAGKSEREERKAEAEKSQQQITRLEREKKALQEQLQQSPQQQQAAPQRQPPSASSPRTVMPSQKERDQWLRRADGDPSKAYRIGNDLRKRQNYDEARSYLFAAVGAGYTASFGLLGAMLAKGEGGPADPEAAARCLLSAVMRGKYDHAKQTIPSREWPEDTRTAVLSLLEKPGLQG